MRAETCILRQQADLAIAALDNFVEKAGRDAAERDRRILWIIATLRIGVNSPPGRVQESTRARLLAELQEWVDDFVARHPDSRFLEASVRLFQGKADDALTIAEATWPKTDSQILLSEFRDWFNLAATLSPVQIARLDRLLVSVAQQKGRPLALLQAVADLRMRFLPQDAPEIEGEILTQDPNNPAALNNLALVNALQGKDAAEAIGQIDRAIAVAGPVAAFLDTRAVALIAGGRPQDALTVLDEVLKDEPTPNRQFHRALAYWRLGQREQATDAFREAMKTGLTPAGIFPLEKRDYQELAEKLAM